jgi:hypothetical protein
VNKQWRLGSKEFIDFDVTVSSDDPLTEVEVEGWTWQIQITQTGTTPTEWLTPSEPVNATIADGVATVRIEHLYTAAVKGLHYVWIKFGPTPAEPIYVAVTFVVL